MHVCLDISDHGYGHLAQIAPVADRLRIHMPNMKLTIRSRIPAKIISRFVTGPIQFEPAASEAKVHMAGPSEMLVKETASEFKNLHENWHDIISHEANVLNALSPDILVTDITYSSLAAAHQVGLPAVGVSSLNWADIYQAYCGVYEESQSIIEQIFAAYNSADAFLQLTPSDAPYHKPCFYRSFRSAFPNKPRRCTPACKTNELYPCRSRWLWRNSRHWASELIA
jgi:hypothetical protein